MAIQYVGGRGAGRAGATSTVNVAINSGLTGGIGAAAIAGDLVVVAVAVGTQARNPSCAISGYTALTQQNVTPTTYDTSFCVSYKIMGSTPDTQVTIPSTGNIADGQGYRIMVFRGVDPTTPLDGVTPTYATGSGVNNRPDGAAITPATAGAWIIVGGGGAAATGTTLFTAAELSGFVSYNGADTNDGTVGMGYYSGWSSGSWNPAVWGGGSVNAANSWAATTLALRPAVVPVELTNVGAIASAVAYGAHLVSVGVLAVGIASGALFGSATVTPYTPSVELTDAGNIGAGEAHGTQVLSLTTAPVGISLSGAYGTQELSLDLIGAGAIAAGEAFGTATVSGAPVELTEVGGIATSEVHGTQVLAADISSSGIASDEAHGAQSLSLLSAPVGVVSAEELGQSVVSAIIRAAGISSSEAFGQPIIQTEYTISGVTRDSRGNPLGDCLVRLFQTDDGTLIEEKMSTTEGSFSFTVADKTTAYFIVAYKNGSPDMAGTTLNKLVGI